MFYKKNIRPLGILIKAFILSVIVSPVNSFADDLQQIESYWQQILASDIEQFKKNIKQEVTVISYKGITIPLSYEAETDSLVESLCLLVSDTHSCENALKKIHDLRMLQKPYATAFDQCWIDAVGLLVDGIFHYIPYFMDAVVKQNELGLSVETHFGALNTPLTWYDNDGVPYTPTVEQVFWANLIRARDLYQFEDGQYNSMTCLFVHTAPSTVMLSEFMPLLLFPFQPLDHYSHEICPLMQETDYLFQLSMYGDEPPDPIPFEEIYRFGYYLHRIEDAYNLLQDTNNQCGYHEEDLDNAMDNFRAADDVLKISTVLALLDTIDENISEEEIKKVLRYYALKEFHPDWERISGKIEEYYMLYDSGYLFSFDPVIEPFM